MSKTIGVTGPNGFIASYVIRRLEQAEQDDIQVCSADRSVLADEAKLDQFVSHCDVICHIAGVNRGDELSIHQGNILLAQAITSAIGRTGAAPHVIFASSTQRDRDNAYGQSKKECEKILLRAADEFDFPITVLVIPNVYGPGCKPFYNSVVATFCHQLAQGKKPTILEDNQVCFLHVNNVVDAFVTEIEQGADGSQIKHLEPAARISVTQLLEKLVAFQTAFFGDGVVPDQADPLDAGLYSTFLSYVDLQDHRHRPPVHRDDRGILFEIIKLANGGQVFFSTTKPGVTRGDHFHTRKFEWFCVVKGRAAIRLRHVQSEEIHEFEVDGDEPEFISIPALYTHHIENIGDEDLLTMFWCNEIFSADDPDTFREKVA